MTGTSQSRMAEISRWAPLRMRRDTSPVAMSGAPSGRAGGRGRGAEVGAGAERLAGGGDHDGPDGQVGRRLLEQVDHAVALVGGDGVADVGSVEGDPGDAVLHAVADLVVERAVVGHGPQRRESLTLRQIRGRRPRRAESPVRGGTVG